MAQLRREASESLRESLSRLNSTLAASEIGTWEFDVINNIVRADQNLARLFGVNPQTAAGGKPENYLKSIHPDDVEKVNTVIRRAIESGENYEADYRLVVPDAAVRWVIARGRIERDSVGRAVRLPGVVVDITAQRQAESKLRMSEGSRRLALDAAELGAWNIDPVAYVLTCDERFRIIFHGSVDPITYEDAFAAIHPDDRQRIREGVAAATLSDEPAAYSDCEGSEPKSEFRCGTTESAFRLTCYRTFSRCSPRLTATWSGPRVG
jgi:PAS domain S-box-containing protein